MAKISAFDQYKDAKVRRQQVVYLHANGFTNDQIAKIAGYAKSTVANYVKKFADLLDNACKLFLKVTKKMREQFSPQMPEHVEKVSRVKAKESHAKAMEFVAKKRESNPQVSFAYIFTFYNENGKPLFLKIGKSNDPIERMRQEVKEYHDKDGITSYAKIEKLFALPNEDRALSFENALREHYKKDSIGYQRNDRFLDKGYLLNELKSDNFVRKSLSLNAA